MDEYRKGLIDGLKQGVDFCEKMCSECTRVSPSFQKRCPFYIGNKYCAGTTHGFCVSCNRRLGTPVDLTTAI